MDQRVLWVDAGAGASGDMILGALVDLGVPLARLRRALDTLPVAGWRLGSRRVDRQGISARKIVVRVVEEGPGRRFRDLRRILEGGDLTPAVRERALAIFRRLIEAEAEAHGLPIDRVHLHEAGGLDAIVDVVGACVGLAHLAPDRIVVSRMTTGFGSVRCRHGVYPVPGPATTLLLRGVPVTAGAVEAERLTPTGAAILTAVADGWGPLPPMTPERVGHGAGDFEFPGHPNVLRMVMGRSDEAWQNADAEDAQIAVLTFTLDDATPQVLAYAAERLLEEGALDVVTTPVNMKKGRAGHRMTVLVRPGDVGAAAERVFRETTTLGLRWRLERRIELERQVHRVATPFGNIRVKTGLLGGRIVQTWPEYDDCARAARRRGVPLKRVQRAALEALPTILPEKPRRAGKEPR